MGLAKSAKDRLDYFTMSTRERVTALAEAGVVTAEEGLALQDALDLFGRIEHIMDLQELTHPATDERADWLEHYVRRTEELTGHATTRSLPETKALVREIFGRLSPRRGQ